MNIQPQQEPTKAPKNLKRMMVIVFVVVSALIIAMFALVAVLENWLAEAQTEQPKGTPQTIIFHTPNYDEDITKDTNYMGLDRQIYFCNPDTGVTVSLDPRKYADEREGVELLCHMIESIIAGDHETYNSFFSDAYLDEVGEKGMFTAQKLYNIKVTILSEEEVSEEGDTYTRETYLLEYMIYQNNGTYRTDVGSDAIRKQGVVITDREGEMKIDALSSYSYVYS